MVRGPRETATSALSFSIALAALVSFDPRVRVKFWSVLGDPNAGVIAPFSDRLGELGSTLWMAARDQSMDNGPFLIFAVVGVALVAFMLRS